MIKCLAIKSMTLCGVFWNSVKFRGQKEISEKMGIKTESYVKRTYIDPLLEKGLLEMTIPAKPGSRKQKYQKAE